jgi:hypothetical protein
VSKRLDRLSESYWELRYEHGQLTSRLNRLETNAGGAPALEPELAAPAVGKTAFVPLSSLKR